MNHTMYWVVSSPDPTLCKGKGVWWLWAVTCCLAWPALGTHTNTAMLKQSKAVRVIQIYIVSNGAITFLQSMSHMTVLKLRSDWRAQIPLRVQTLDLRRRSEDENMYWESLWSFVNPFRTQNAAYTQSGSWSGGNNVIGRAGRTR